jgi:hypothetical protein
VRDERSPIGRRNQEHDRRTACDGNWALLCQFDSDLPLASCVAIP